MSVLRRDGLDVGRLALRVSLGVIGIEAIWVFVILLGSDPDVLVALDFRIYRDAAARWLGGGGFYLPGQLAGPYEIEIGDVLYPPVVLWLLTPFVVLPAFLWWLIPVGLTVFAIWRLRPANWAWPLILALLLWPRFPQLYIHGNPTMWMIAFASLALLYGWPGPFVLIKPVLAPFALIGVRRRAWWVGLAVFLLLGLPFGEMWSQWIEATLNSGGATYAFGDYQAMLLPLVAWAASTRDAPGEPNRRIDGQPVTVIGRALARARGAAP